MLVVFIFFQFAIIHGKKKKKNPKQRIGKEGMTRGGRYRPFVLMRVYITYVNFYSYMSGDLFIFHTLEKITEVKKTQKSEDFFFLISGTILADLAAPLPLIPQLFRSIKNYTAAQVSYTEAASESMESLQQEILCLMNYPKWTHSIPTNMIQSLLHFKGFS